MLGDVGGAAELIWFILRGFITVFANYKMTALAGNRMYTTTSTKLSQEKLER